MKNLFAAAVLLITFTPATAQTSAQPADSAAAPTQPAKDKADRMICQTDVDTGSRVAVHRTCMTASQWKEHQLRTQSELDQFHMNTQNKGGSPQ
jgi:hypothetical protein